MKAWIQTNFAVKSSWEWSSTCYHSSHWFEGVVPGKPITQQRALALTFLYFIYVNVIDKANVFAYIFMFYIIFKSIYLLEGTFILLYFFYFYSNASFFIPRNQRRIWSPLERLRWRIFFANIAKRVYKLTIFAERLSRGCSTGH